MNWLPSILTAVSGGLIFEAIKFFYPDLRQWFQSRQQARRILFECWDPTLKSADELYGKLTSLAAEDFLSFIHSQSNDNTQKKYYVYYLFSQFWASIEIVRLRSNYSSIARLKKGRHFLKFIETLESKKFRILDRSEQRIIGEALIHSSQNNFRIMSLYSFFQKLDSDQSFKNWISQLDNLFSKVADKRIRQRILLYGVIIAAFINHFDPKHKIVRKREIYFNKLDSTSAVKIKRILLTSYLPFLRTKQNYYKKIRARKTSLTSKRTTG